MKKIKAWALIDKNKFVEEDLDGLPHFLVYRRKIDAEVASAYNDNEMVIPVVIERYE